MRLKTSPTEQRIVTLHTQLMRGSTEMLAKWIQTSGKLGCSKKSQNALFEKIISFIQDPEPELSMSVSEKSPLPSVRGALAFGPIHPIQVWRKIEACSVFWPREVMRAARPLKFGSGKLPKWRQIQAYFDGIGFAAVPVPGYVGLPVISYLVARKHATSSTMWAIRHRVCPYNLNPTDVLHDLGHGLAMAMPDYRELIVEYSKKVCLLKNKRSLYRAELAYYRLFERAYVLTRDGTASPIGSLSMTFDNLRAHRGRVIPAQRSTLGEIEEMDRGYYFRSRKKWANEVERVVSSLR